MAGELIAAQLRVFRAVEDRASCEMYYAAHRRALEAHAMTGITSFAPVWFDDPYVHVLLLESRADGTPLLGVRIHLAHGRASLPTERVDGYAAELDDYVQQRLATGIGEICGAWADPMVAKSRAFPLMMCAAFALAGPLGAREVLGSCGTYTLQLFQDVGFVIETNLGDRGTFRYPTPTRLSFFIAVRDSMTLSDALAEHREMVFDLRARPVQRRVLESERVVLDVDVDLRLERAVAEEAEGSLVASRAG